jgi:hypothetical protein
MTSIHPATEPSSSGRQETPTAAADLRILQVPVASDSQPDAGFFTQKHKKKTKDKRKKNYKKQGDGPSESVLLNRFMFLIRNSATWGSG